MARECARWVDGHFCGQPFTSIRTITIMTAADALADLEYVVDLCPEHVREYDRDHV